MATLISWEGRRIEQAGSIPLSSFTRPQTARFDKTKPVYLLCQSGTRAKTAAEKLKSFGFEETPDHRWNLERQVRFTAGLLVVRRILLLLVHRGFLILSGFVGAGLVFAAVTDTCGMAMLLAKMPWNRFPTKGEKP